MEKVVKYSTQVIPVVIIFNEPNLKLRYPTGRRSKYKIGILLVPCIAWYEIR